MVYPSLEHAYQASKSKDPAMREMIHDMTQGAAKRFGKGITPPDWGQVKVGVMEQLVRKKFQNKDLAALLIATGDAELVEGNRWKDTFWGVCQGVGQNHLGRILMKVRQEVVSASASPPSTQTP